MASNPGAGRHRQCAGAWQADCNRPPGLMPGRHRVRIRTRHSRLSNAVEFEMTDESGNAVALPSELLPTDPPSYAASSFNRRATVGSRSAGAISGLLFQVFG